METVTTPDVTTQEVPLDARLRIAHSDPSLEMLVLGHHFLHRELQSSKARIDAQLSSGIDPQQIEDEFDEHSMNGAIAPGAGSESESDDD